MFFIAARLTRRSILSRDSPALKVKGGARCSAFLYSVVIARLKVVAIQSLQSWIAPMAAKLILLLVGLLRRLDSLGDRSGCGDLFTDQFGHVARSLV